MIASVVKDFTFEASHTLPHQTEPDGSPGKCQRHHGHSYRAQVEVTGPVREEEGNSQQGMVVDFGHLKVAWTLTGAELDHQHLNDLLPVIPTAENIAAWLLMELRQVADGPEFGYAQVTAVTVHETASSSATARMPYG